MIDQNIKNKDCCGCKLCKDVCKFDAIEFTVGNDGFWYPAVNYDKCVGCGACYKLCPVLAADKEKKKDRSSVKCYGAKSKDERLRLNSTSGGLFGEFALKFLADGAVCCGAGFDDDFRLRHMLIDSDNDLVKLQKSKYVQSDTQGIYIQIRKILDTGKKVLFSGTPCQIEALMNYLPKDYPNLFTIDFICCGVPSPLAFDKYIQMIESRYNAHVEDVWFKNKEMGWHKLGTKIEMSNGKKYFRTGNRDLFMSAYIEDGLTIRESCSHCRFRHVPHSSDVTIGDFWGIENVKPEFDDNKGTSAVILNSSKGIELFEVIKEKLDYFETTLDSIAAGNFTLYKAKSPAKERDLFLEMLNKETFAVCMKKYGSYKGMKRLKIDIKYFIKQILSSITKK